MSEPYRVLVIEDDLDVALYTKTVLEKRAGCIVVTVPDPADVLPALRELQPDVVLTDIELPGTNGLELMSAIREEYPGIPIIVMTAHVSVDYAVSALRNHANEFLTKPVSSPDLVAIVERLGQEYRLALASAPTQQVVLAIGAHPDDVEIGVGGILAAHRAAGDDVTILTLTRGTREGGVRTAWTEGSASAATIGATLLLEDTQEEDISSGEPTSGLIKRTIEQLRPDVVYVHSRHDRSAVHRAVHDATVVASTSVPAIACYQSSTSTVDFSPIRFVSITDHLESKLAMLACFATEGKRTKYLDPEFITATARYWGRFAQATDCEPLEVLRESAEVA